MAEGIRRGTAQGKDCPEGCVGIVRRGSGDPDSQLSIRSSSAPACGLLPVAVLDRCQVRIYDRQNVWMNLPEWPHGNNHMEEAPNRNESVRIDSPTRHKERIRRIAAELFAQQGYSAVGVAELGKAVNLGRGALYYHIGSKEDLLFDISKTYMEDLIGSATAIVDSEPDPVECVHKLSAALMDVVFDRHADMTVCFREVHSLTGDRRKEVLRLHREYQDIWDQVFQRGHELGAFVPVDAIALKGILGMYFYSFLWIRPNVGATPSEVAETFADLVLASVKAPRPV